MRWCVQTRDGIPILRLDIKHSRSFKRRGIQSRDDDVNRDIFQFVLPENARATAYWTPRTRIRRTEQSDCRTAEIGGEMRDAGIVSDEGTACAQKLRQFHERQIRRYRARFREPFH